ncbi:hypothetical protein AJ79_10221 [Helicocarpus griseus UAMH5409]|uniref:WW-domain-binding protein n=1 Tax=Helicocarpus griseus UAMH5409 TaxID=1447875 RepID=A0A2B7WF86_9EURO|nr:hypothetical protein AJ79_10221 [Helicocarpus griseus UAMH5409]
MSFKSQKKTMLSRLRPSSWVMLHETEGFVRLPNERTIYTSPPRTSLSLQTVNSRSGNEPVSIQSSTGCVHLTNQRIVYLPAQSTPQFQSFSAPLLNLLDTHVSAPFFGPNVWTAQVKPVAGGGIPASNISLQLKMTFKDGGAFDFHSNFERIKERLQQAVEQAQESGMMTGDGPQTGSGRRAGAFGSVNFSAVHLEELPAYEGPGRPVEPVDATAPPPFSPRNPIEHNQPVSNRANSASGGDSSTEDRYANPTEPPPGYEEVQQQSVASDLEARLRGNQ